MKAINRSSEDREAAGLLLPERGFGQKMTIKEVSNKYGIPQDTLRYYERVGMIPPVTRTPGGIRDYQETDLAWVELVICMRSAGLTVEGMTEYVQLCKQGDSTIPKRCILLKEQKAALLEKRKKIDAALERLNYKIGRYEEAVKTGELSWKNKEMEEEK